MTRAVCIGECMIELSARSDGTYVRAFAGDAYNTAVHLKRCTPALEVQFATVTGDDTLSEAMREAWLGEGIDDSLATRAPGLSPGLYLAETDGDGERRFSYWRGQSAARRWLPALEGHGEAIAGADLLFMTGISLAILRPEDRARALDLIDRLRPTIGLFAFDPNIRPSLWDSERAMRETCEAATGRADILLPSLDDAAELWGAAGAEVHFRHALALGAREVALTLGPEGCLVTSLDGSARRIAAQPVAVIDSAGAGDAFNGAYLASRLMGEAPEAAAAAGLALAKRVLGHAGALPSAADLAGGTP
jgi:2-dehydro-3-deoxygluconokinase